MSVTLKLKHVDGLRLRQQQASKVSRTENGAILSGTEWKFEHYPAERDGSPGSIDQDRHIRELDADGQKRRLGTYTAYVTAGLKNLVVELKQPKVTHIDFQNSALRNSLRIRYQILEEVKKDGKKSAFEWRDSGAPQYVPPNTWTGVFVGDKQRAIVDEMPT